ncbi:MAG: pentapeptide repeat-containing protein [Cyanobacteria bacterium]|nr:pentapeptide repeat-containing protein [Cyanobacteria bacterium GSL.Bin21]
MRKTVQRTMIRLLIAILGTMGLIGLILSIEAIFGSEKSCPPPESWLLCRIRNSVLLNVVEGFSILVALILFFLEAPERAKQAHYEAWKVIDAAHGVETSYARLQALQDLNEDQVSLTRLDASGADLKGINLNAAELTHAQFSGTDLSHANLSHADLSHADLMRANLNNAELNNARLIDANLSHAQLIDADLVGTEMIGANLSHAHLVGANLSKAYFGDADFNQACLRDANLDQTKLFGVRNLTLEQVKAAKNWQEAIYDETFRQKLGL